MAADYLAGCATSSYEIKAQIGLFVINACLASSVG
jgi:hypothetical protein